MIGKKDYINKEDINTIGDELFFQIDYHNCKYPNEKISFDRNAKTDSNDICVLTAKKYMQLTKKELNCKDGYYKGFSYDVLYNIKMNNIAKNRLNKDHREVNNMDTYYIIIFCAFKVLGFLDDYNILKLLKRYNIQPKNEEMKEIYEKVKQESIVQYNEDNNKLPFYINKPMLVESKNIMELLELQKNVIFFSNKEFLIKRYSSNIRPITYISFRRFKEYIFEKLKKLSIKEKRILSLECGQSTDFIDQLIKGKIDLFQYDSLKKMLEFFELTNSDIYFFITKRIESNSGKFKEYKPFGVYEDL